jgi:hypothetical protein
MRMSTSATSTRCAIDRGQSAQAVVGFGDDFVRQLGAISASRSRRRARAGAFVVDDDH